jgi:hypothetical protein
MIGVSNLRPFSMPEKGEIYIEQVLERVGDLIATGIWEGLGVLRLSRWMNNFASPLERYFAACVLDALTYRSAKQTVALMEQMFQRILPDRLRLDPPDEAPTGDWYGLLRRPSGHGDPGLRIVPVIRLDDSPTKSGPALARLYRRHLGLNDEWMIWPWRIKAARAAGIRAFLFIDDFLGTGTQFSRFADQFSVGQELSGAYAIYAPLSAHVKGIRKINERIPDMRVCAVEVLDASHCLFDSESRCFDDGVNSPDSAAAFYDDLLRNRCPGIADRYKRGFGNLSLAYAFAHGTPNNCLPLLWTNRPTWASLFER